MSNDVITPRNDFFYPNKMSNILLRALKETLGREQMGFVMREGGLEEFVDNYPPNDLRKEYPFYGVSGITAGLESVYGIEKGRQMAAELGHLSFVRGIIDFDPMLGIIDMPRRLMPLGMKIRLGLDIFAVVFNRFSDQIVQIGEDRESYHWIIKRCAVCHGRETKSPACHLAVGILEESLSWVSNGREFQVEETCCLAAGDESCTIAIHKKPLN